MRAGSAKPSVRWPFPYPLSSMGRAKIFFVGGTVALPPFHPQKTLPASLTGDGAEVMVKSRAQALAADHRGIYPSLSVLRKASSARSSPTDSPRLPSSLVFKFGANSGAGQGLPCQPAPGTSRVL